MSGLRPAIVLLALQLAVAPAAEPDHGHPDFRPGPERPVGWRGGTGSGWYPGARGVATSWSDRDGHNIIWRTALPFLSAASPIVVGDRIITTAEPDELICLDADTGAVLWRRSTNPILEQLSPAAAEEARAMHARFVRLSREWAYETGSPDCRFAFPDQKKGVPAEATAWLDRHAALLAELGLTGVDLAELAREFYRERNEESKAHGLIRPTGWKTWYGGCMPTPVSDGSHIYAKFACGALVCYDLAGERRWLVDRGLQRGHHDVSSLALAGDVLLDHTQMTGDWQGRKPGVAAYDARTGRALWTTAAPKGEWAAGSPVATRIGGLWVLLTAGGDVIRVRDGKILLSRQWNSFTGSSPIVHDGVVYSCNMAQGVEGSIGAVRLLPGPDDTISSEVLWWWTKWWRGNKGFTSTEGSAIDAPMPGAGRGSPAVAHGRVFFVGGTTGLVLTVVDTASGQPVPWTDQGHKATLFTTRDEQACQELGITGGREASISATVADGHLFVGYSAVPRSLFVVLRIGADGRLEEVARNTVEGLTIGTPFFQGDRMYLRTFDHLSCIGSRR